MCSWYHHHVLISEEQMASLRKTVKVHKIVLFGSGSSHWSYLLKAKTLSLMPVHTMPRPAPAVVAVSCSTHLLLLESKSDQPLREFRDCSRLYIWNKFLCSLWPKANTSTWCGVAGSCRSSFRLFWVTVITASAWIWVWSAAFQL